MSDYFLNTVINKRGGQRDAQSTVALNGASSSHESAVCDRSRLLAQWTASTMNDNQAFGTLFFNVFLSGKYCI